MGIKEWRIAVTKVMSWSLVLKAFQSVYKLLIIGWSPSRMSEQIVEAIENASQIEQAALLERFVQNKHLELGTVLIGSALVASLAASLLSWSWFPVPPYPARVAILVGIVHSLIGLGIASQQYIVLARINLHPQRMTLVRGVLLGTSSSSSSSPVSSSSHNGHRSTGKWKHIAWQIPTMLLGNGTVFVVVGLAISIFAEARQAGRWGSEAVTALAFAICLLFSTGCYFVSWINIERHLQSAITDLALNP